MMNEHFLNATVQYIKTLFTSHMAKTLNPTSTRKAETDRRTYEPLHYVNSSQAVGYIHAGKVWQIYLKLFTILPAGVHSRVRVSPFSTVPPRSTPAYAKNGLLCWILYFIFVFLMLRSSRSKIVREKYSAKFRMSGISCLLHLRVGKTQAWRQ